MLFNSLGYLLFLALAIPLHWVLPRRFRVHLLCALSLLFYAMWRWEFCLLMIFSALVDFTASRRIAASTGGARRKAWLLTSLSVNLGLLVFFKYTYFLYDSLRAAAGLGGQALPALGMEIILPLGISFYTFQTISYTIDVYRNAVRPVDDFVLFLTYVTFWPQLIAGPILRAGEVIPQLKGRRSVSAGDVSAGLERILSGLFKKVVLADNIAPLVDQAFAIDPGALSAFDVWVAAFLFGFQIYFDFSGYSDVAIGSARLLGIGFPENFDWPYLSRSPREFWKRWHISLSSWVRDYLYLPVAGSQFHTRSTGGIAAAADRGGARFTLALFITWFLMGLWHGAGWNFALWGIYHGGLVYLYRKIAPLRSLPTRLPLLAWGLTLLLSMAGWIPFRSQSLSQTLGLFQKILNPLAYDLAHRGLHQESYLAALFLVLSMAALHRLTSERVRLWTAPIASPLRLATITVLTFFTLTYLRNTSQFIYFQF